MRDDPDKLRRLEDIWMQGVAASYDANRIQMMLFVLVVMGFISVGLQAVSFVLRYREGRGR